MTLRATSQRRGSAAKRTARRTLAAQADRHALYESAVQDPELDAQTMARLFRRYRDRQPLVLREDFCGTAALSTAWVKAKPDRRAIGIDLDEPTMAWGRKHHIEPAGPDVARRVQLHEANVLDGVGGRADIVCALNFSYCIFKEREDMRAYLAVARKKLVRDGVLILDLLGGWESMQTELLERRYRGFRYQWEQEKFDPLTHEIRCHIHFAFPDGSMLRRAFSYDWRLWTAPELADLLRDVGFTNVHFLWERTDDDGEGTGVFYEPKSVENQESWWTYVVAER